MSDFHRRDLLTGAAAIADGMTAATVGSRTVEAGDPSFMNNVPDPLLSRKKLPTFKFASVREVPAQGRVHRGRER